MGQVMIGFDGDHAYCPFKCPRWQYLACAQLSAASLGARTPWVFEVPITNELNRRSEVEWNPDEPPVLIPKFAPALWFCELESRTATAREHDEDGRTKVNDEYRKTYRQHDHI